MPISTQAGVAGKATFTIPNNSGVTAVTVVGVAVPYQQHQTDTLVTLLTAPAAAAAVVFTYNQATMDIVTEVTNTLKKVSLYSQTLTPASVAAATSAEQLFTITGLEVGERVIVNKPSLSAGIVIGNARVSAANTLAITFGNVTAGALVPIAEAYSVVALGF